MDAHILTLLKREYPEVSGTALRHRNPVELLVATILSAQTTDVQVNKVTEKLFKKYRSAEDYAGADLEELRNDIRSVNFYRNKGRFIQECCRMILNDYGGSVPDSMEELVKLPGVNRKTANVVLTNAFGKVEGVVVDTHVMRVSRRLGLATESKREKIERELMNAFPREEWAILSDLLIAHGRRVCRARNPRCEECVLRERCLHYRKMRAEGKE